MLFVGVEHESEVRFLAVEFINPDEPEKTGYRAPYLGCRTRISRLFYTKAASSLTEWVKYS